MSCRSKGVHESYGVRVPYEGFGWAGSNVHSVTDASIVSDHELHPSVRKRAKIMTSKGIIDCTFCMTPKYI